MSFANLKSRSGDISKLVSAAQEASGGGNTSKNKYDDDRKWKPTVDDSGNGYTVVRFLPALEGMEHHGFVTGITVLKDPLVNGTSRNHVLHLVRKIHYQS